jgi:hypothetical protein
MKFIVLGVVCFLLAPSPEILAQEIRIDTFDKKSNRTGYIIIDPRTGRLDQFDKNSDRLGYGTVTSPPSSARGSGLYDQNGRSISIDRRAR